MIVGTFFQLDQVDCVPRKVAREATEPLLGVVELGGRLVVVMNDAPNLHPAAAVGQVFGSEMFQHCSDRKFCDGHYPTFPS